MRDTFININSQGLFFVVFNKLYIFKQEKGKNCQNQARSLQPESFFKSLMRIITIIPTA